MEDSLGYRRPSLKTKKVKYHTGTKNKSFAVTEKTENKRKIGRVYRGHCKVKHLKKKNKPQGEWEEKGEVSGAQWEGDCVWGLRPPATGQAHCLQLRKRPQDKKEVLGA